MQHVKLKPHSHPWHKLSFHPWQKLWIVLIIPSGLLQFKNWVNEQIIELKNIWISNLVRSDSDQFYIIGLTL